MKTISMVKKSLKFLKKTPKDHKLELVHSDLWGPVVFESLGGARYFVTFIDDHNKKVWIYCLKYKSDVFVT